MAKKPAFALPSIGAPKKAPTPASEDNYVDRNVLQQEVAGAMEAFREQTSELQEAKAMLTSATKAAAELGRKVAGPLRQLQASEAAVARLEAEAEEANGEAEEAEATLAELKREQAELRKELDKPVV